MKDYGHSAIAFLVRLFEAFRHVRTGGRTTRTKAVRKTAAPPPRCPTCRQPIPRSADWRDHIH